MAAVWALKVVDAAGHPTPGPRRFCRVTVAALRRASLDALESSSGKLTWMVGLLTAWPAATLAFKA